MNENKLFEMPGCPDAYLILTEVNRYYFTGFRSSFGMLLITKGKKYYATDMRYGLAAKQSLSGYELILGNEKQCNQGIAAALKECGVKTLGYEDGDVTVRQFEKMRSDFENVEFVACGENIANLRMIKTEQEIEWIEKSESIASQAFSKILNVIKIGMTEKELATELEYQIKKLGGEGTSFDTIVAFGENSAKPHAQPTDRKLIAGDIILMDYGTKYNGYCSDITRTVCMGKGNDTFRHIYDIVLQAGEYAIDNIKEGLSCREADSFAREFIIANNFGSQFYHGLGHGVGLEIHEGPAVSGNSTDILKENMAITVEPGIYIDGVGGVRIEDLVIVGKDGMRNITTASKEMTIL